MTQRHHQLTRRQLLAFGLAATAAPRLAFADEFPSRPIRIFVGVTPGGSLDTGARIVAQGLHDVLKTPVIVENKPGAGGLLASDAVTKAPADGYTLLYSPPGPVIIAPQAMPGAKFNVMTDLAPVNMTSTTPIAIAVNPKLGVSTMKELVALSKKRAINMGLPLVGSLSHVVVEMTASASGCNFLNVAYKGASPALTDTLAGHVDATVSDVGVLLPYHRENKLKIIMVTSEKRHPALPDVRTGAEDYPGLVATNWNGIFATPKTPPAVLDKISGALKQLATRPDIRKQYELATSTPANLEGPEAFQKFIAAEYVRYGRIVRERNIVIS